jgi:hypothetical protein
MVKVFLKGAAIVTLFFTFVFAMFLLPFKVSVSILSVLIFICLSALVGLIAQ